MKVYYFFLAFSLVLLGSNANAVTNCPAAKVKHIQAETNQVLYHLEGYNWHKLGDVDKPATQYMYSALLAAQMSGKSVTVRYPDGYDCSAYNTSISAYVVRTHNQ